MMERAGNLPSAVDTVDSVVIFGRPSMTTPFIIEMIGRQVDIQLFTTDGHCQAASSDPATTYAPRLRTQVNVATDPRIRVDDRETACRAQIRNQIALVEAHVADRDRVDKPFKQLRRSLAWIEQSCLDLRARWLTKATLQSLLHRVGHPGA